MSTSIERRAKRQAKRRSDAAVRRLAVYGVASSRRFGPFQLARVPSWEWAGVRAKYGRLGAWKWDRGLTFRVRDRLLIVSLRPRPRR